MVGLVRPVGGLGVLIDSFLFLFFVFILLNDVTSKSHWNRSH